jgi:hypothetical protein
MAILSCCFGEPFSENEESANVGGVQENGNFLRCFFYTESVAHVSALELAPKSKEFGEQLV